MYFLILHTNSTSVNICIYTDCHNHSVSRTVLHEPTTQSQPSQDTCTYWQVAFAFTTKTGTESHRTPWLLRSYKRGSLSTHSDSQDINSMSSQRPQSNGAEDHFTVVQRNDCTETRKRFLFNCLPVPKKRWKGETCYQLEFMSRYLSERMDWILKPTLCYLQQIRT